MKKLSRFLIGCLGIAPFAAHAAGTYYTGAYQPVQQGYAQQRYAPQGYSSQGYAQQRGYASTGYSRYQPMQPVPQQQQQRQQSQPSASSGTQTGLKLDASYSRETAQWEFSMKDAGSMLHYDNIAWNVFDVNAGYVFNAGNTPLEINAGVKFGFQGGESSMVDDDITNGGYFITQWITTDGDVIGNEIGHALSVGTSSGGSMFGYNVGFGLTDFFKLGNTKITPSVGWRSMSYTLETKKNYGLSMATSACFTLESGEVQCDPAIVIDYSDGSQQIIWREDIMDPMEIGDNAVSIDTGDTYYYQQPGTSHSYEVEWAGPYLALDMVYDINQNNAVTAHVELGLPGYTATGNQPYRFDWQHPKSIEDTSGIGSALSFGFGADWRTALTNSIMLSVGLTYNYYTVSGANANTYLNSAFYNDLYASAQEIIDGTVPGNVEYAEQVQENIDQLKADCPGWVCKSNGEVDSFYKSMGIRLGLAARF